MLPSCRARGCSRQVQLFKATQKFTSSPSERRKAAEKNPFKIFFGSISSASEINTKKQRIISIARLQKLANDTPLVLQGATSALALHEKKKKKKGKNLNRLVHIFYIFVKYYSFADNVTGFVHNILKDLTLFNQSVFFFFYIFVSSTNQYKLIKQVKTSHFFSDMHEKEKKELIVS